MAKRRIKKARCKIISLVPFGHNKTKTLFKSDDGEPYTEFSAAARMRKGAEGLLDILVYVPECEDREGDIASAEVIKDICHNFIPSMEGSGIDILHSLETLSPEDAHVCETFIVQKGDPRFVDVVDDEGNKIDPEGSWAVTVKLDNPTVRALYEVEGWHGASMYGSMIVKPLTKADFANALGSRLGTPQSQERDMNEEKLAEMLKSFTETISATLVKAVEGIKPKVEDTPADDTPVEIEFVGDQSKLEDIEAHEEKLFKAGLNFNDANDVAKWKAYVLKKSADANDENDKGDKGESEELTQAKARVVELEKASKQGTGDVPSGEDAGTKMEKGRKLGSEVAQRLIKAQQSNRYGVRVS